MIGKNRQTKRSKARSRKHRCVDQVSRSRWSAKLESSGKIPQKAVVAHILWNELGTSRPGLEGGNEAHLVSKGTTWRGDRRLIDSIRMLRLAGASVVRGRRGRLTGRGLERHWRKLLDRQGVHGRHGLQALRVWAHGLLHWRVGGSLVAADGVLLGLLAQVRTSDDAFAECVEGYPALGVDLEDTLEDPIQAGGNGQDGGKEIGVLHEGTESGVLGRSSLPWVAAADEVDQDDAKTPHVVGCRFVASERLRCLLAFYKEGFERQSLYPARMPSVIHTRAHVEGRSTSKVGSDAVLRGKAKIGKLDGPSIILNEDVLGLEIAMVNPVCMAMSNRIQDLEKDVLGLRILTHVISFLGDFGEEVAFWAVLQDNKGAIVGLEDLLHRHHVRMLAGLVVKPDLAVLEASLSLIEAEPVQGLDGVLCTGVHILSAVNGSISTHTEDVRQFYLMVAIDEEKA